MSSRPPSRIAAWLALTGCGATSALIGCGAASAPHTSISEAETAETKVVAVGLRLTEMDSPDDSPRTRIVLVIIDPDLGRTTTPVGEFTGVCSPAPYGPEDLGRARCWWEGVETNVRLRNRGSTLVAETFNEDGATVRVLAEAPVSEDSELTPIGASGF